VTRFAFGPRNRLRGHAPPCVLAITAWLSGCTTAANDGDGSTQANETQQSETDQGESETGELDFTSYEFPGPHPVGFFSFVLGDPAGARPLRVEIWIPASEQARAAAAAGRALEEFATDESEAMTLAELVAQAPDECVRKRSAGASTPEPADLPGPWPTVVFSHCHGCVRFSSASFAEHLASHGFMVAAVEHAGSTLFDALGDGLPPLNQATLELRRDDVIRVIDELLDPAAVSLPGVLVGLADPDRLGVFGHSFGAITTGIVLQDDPRPRAGLAIAAPIESPLIPGVSMAGITKPLALFVAVEDNSITEFGNAAIRSNFEAAVAPVWKLEFADTGHFGFSDLAGLSDYFAAGCGDGLRQTTGEPFTYADPFVVRSLAAGRIAAFFALHLLDDDAAAVQLEAPDDLLDIAKR
jgi:dienelactone hydrolase